MLFSVPELDAREVQVLVHIEDLKQRLRHQLHEPRRWYGSLRRLSIARAIQGSNSIEGFDANLEDAAAVAVGEEPLDADQETRLALKGYRDAMTYVLQLASDEDFSYSSQVLKALHFMMTSYDLNNRPGRWRAGAVYVRNDETEQIVYEGPDIDQVPALMEDLSTRLNGPCDERIIQAAMAHLNLVMIHPFRDGNGRMARCLQSLVLARGGVLAPVFMSIEEYLGRNTQKYYDVLAEVGCGSWQPNNDARPWVRFTLTAHLRQARTMLRRIRETERLWVNLEDLIRGSSLPDRVMLLLFDAASGLRVRNATYRASLEEAGDDTISEQTASRDLQRLVAAGLLRPVGEKRTRSYSAGSDLLRIRQDIVAARDSQDDSDPFA
ncbi:MAG TPA: Fic family protein [Streptosporangiaceae bacterium]|nr:Fic family protein [Streptosporangiaceae bacterium]